MISPKRLSVRVVGMMRLTVEQRHFTAPLLCTKRQFWYITPSLWRRHISACCARSAGIGCTLCASAAVLVAIRTVIANGKRIVGLSEAKICNFRRVTRTCCR